MNLKPKAVYGSKWFRVTFYAVALSVVGSAQDTPYFFGTTEAAQGWTALAVLLPIVHLAFILLAAATRQSKATWQQRRSAFLSPVTSSPSIYCLLVLGYATAFGPLATTTRGWAVLMALVVLVLGVEVEPSPGEPAAKP